MIKTKQKQVIDARENKKDIVYIKVVDILENKLTKEIKYYLVLMTKKDELGPNKEVIYTQLGDTIIAIFKKSTLLNLYGKMMLVDFDALEDQLMIDQIHYINNYLWTGKEAQSSVRFWNLKSEDLEIVS